MADSKAFVAKHGLAVNSPSTIVFGSNAKLHANNTITAGTITGAMLATGVAGTDDSTVLATNTALRALISDRLQVANATTLFLETGGSSGDEQSVGGQVTFSHNVIVSGNLTVSGTQTIINTNTLNVGDNIITLNSDETGTPSQNAGIEVERGTGTNVQLRWNETSDKWQFTNDGSSYEDIGAGITVQEEGSALSTAATTLNFVGAAVTATGSGATKTITISGGDIVNDTTPQLGGDLDLNGNSITGSGHIDIGDDNRLKLGASDDLQIYHDGSHSYIDESGTGYLIIKSSELQIQSDGGEDMAKFEPDGSVRLYHNNVEKITTTSGGVTVAGNIVVSGTVDGVDVAALNTSVSGKLSDIVDDTSPQLGGNLDLNSSNITGTGNINITGTSTISGLSSLSGAQFDGNVTPTSGQGVEIFAPDTSTGQIQSFDRTNSNFDKLIIKGDPVEIYDGSTKRIETTSTGIDVTGTVEFDGLSGTGSVAVTDILDEDNMSSDSATALATQQSIKAYVDANAGASVSNGSNDRILTSTGGNGIQAESDFQFDGTNVFIPNEIRHVGDPDTKLGFGTDTITLTAGGVAIQTMTTSKVGLPDSKEIALGTSDDLTLMHDGTHSEIRNRTGQLYIRANEIFLRNNDNNVTYLTGTNGGSTELYYSNNKKLETTSTGITVTGTLTATTLAGTLSTAAQANITSLGTLTALAVSGATNLGTVQAETLAIENPASHHTYTVTVASKTSAHPYTGQGSSSAYFLDGKESPSIVLAPNMTYRFDQADNTNSGHPLRFFLEADKTTAYTTGVTTNGTAGSSGAYTQIVVTDATPPVLYYQCSAHAYMGSVSSSLTEGRLSDISDVHTTAPTDGQALVWDNSNSYWAPGTVGGALTIQDEGSALSTSGTTLNFVGAGVTASGTGATKTITIPGGSSSLTVQDEGSALSTAATTLNFVGSGVTASGIGSTKTITISGTGTTSAYTPAPKYARLTLTGDQNLGSGSATTTITNFNTRAVDSSDSNALTSTLADGKFIIPAGVSKVKLRASLEFSGTTDQVVMKFLKNGSNLEGSTNFEIQSTGGDYPAAFTGIIDVSQNDYFQVQIFHQSGTAIAETDANFSWFELEVVEGSILGGLGNLSTLQDVHNASPTDGQALVWDNSNSYWAPGTVGAAITVQEEGSSLSTSATTLNFVGAGVTASGTGATKTITISGGGSSGSTNLGGQFTSGTGNGSATTFTSPINTNLANNLIVSVDGIMQRPTTDYTVSGTTVTFGTAPPAGTAVLVRSFSGAMSSKADFTVQNFTANGSNTVYKLAESVTSGDHVLVSINGIIQRNTTDYTYNTGNGNITFDEAPASGDIISFRTFDLQQSTSATVSDTAPSSPRNGDFWFDSSTAKLYMYYEDGSSNQWVSLSVAGAAGADGADGTPTVYANTSVLPSSGNSVGDLAFATLTKSLHVWDGSEWDRINSGGDENPRLTTVPASTLSLSGVTGANQSVTMVASDPEGFPITYSYDTNPANTNKASIVNHANGVFKIVPSTNSSHAGDFTLRLKASDGVHISSHAIACSLVFQTTITFDTSSSTINSTYTGNNKADVTVTASTIAINEQDLALGKGYLEYKIINDGNYPMMGLVAGSHNGTYGSNDALYIYHDGAKYPGGHGQSLSSSSAGDIIMIAYDTAAGSHGKVWFGMNGTWQSSLSASDVASGTGGWSFAAGDSNTNGLRVAFNSGGGGGDNYRIEIISHTQGAQYTIPTGFTLA